MSTINLALAIHSNVSSSYTNRWWAGMLRESVATNAQSNLNVLTQDDVEINVAKKLDIYIDFPELKRHIDDGVYHLNIQGTSKVFIGWIQVKEGTAVWWAQNGSDNVCTGSLGDVSASGLMNVAPWSEILNRSTPVYYTDNRVVEAEDASVYELLKMFW